MIRPSPTTYLDGRDPPALLIHGAVDQQAPVSQSRTFNDALARVGVKSELVLLPGINHSWVGATPEATRTASLEAPQRTFDFIDSTIADPPRP